MKIAVDIDGVLADFTAAFADVINHIYPGKVPPGYQPEAWNWPILTREEESAGMDLVKATEDFWLSVKPLKENVAALDDFIWSPKTKQVEIYYVTARMRTAGHSLLAQTSRWLATYGLMASHTSVMPVSDGLIGKVRAFASIGIDYSIDDRDRNVEAAVNQSGPKGKLPGHKAYLLDQAWNRSATLLDPYRVQSLEEYLDIIRRAL